VKEGAAELGLELRRGWEVFPSVLRDSDPVSFGLEGTQAVLVEFPGHWLALENDSVLVREAADRIMAADLVPIVAHPERSVGLRHGFEVAADLVESGCLLCPNSDSLLGRNGPAAEQLVRRLLDEGLVALIASDGHRAGRPPRLDEAYDLLLRSYGADFVEPLFDGSALPWTRLPGPSTP
jgi:protein-tyrosine phosphatase